MTECADDLLFLVPACPAGSGQKRLVTARPLEDPLEVRPPEGGGDRLAAGRLPTAGLHEPPADIAHEWKDCSISAGY